MACGSLPVQNFTSRKKTINSSLNPIMSKQELEYRVLKLVEKQPTITQRQLSKELGVSLGKTHYVIKALVRSRDWIQQRLQTLR